MKPGNKNSYNSLDTIDIDNKSFNFYSLSKAEKNGLDGISYLSPIEKSSKYLLIIDLCIFDILTKYISNF